MAYKFYLNHTLLPVPPESINYSIGNKNNVINLINDFDYNVLKAPSLTEISFDALIPAFKYPFAMYDNEFIPQKYFLNTFRDLKNSKIPLRLLIIRKFPNGKSMYNSHFNSLSLESYNIVESAKNGLDVVVSLKFKEFKRIKTSVISIGDDGSIKEEFIRESENSPQPIIQNKTHTVKKGDSLWNIAKYYYGDGTKYKIIADANSDIISNPNKLSIGQVLIIPNT